MEKHPKNDNRDNNIFSFINIKMSKVFSKKIVLLGDTAVGKTSLCARLVNGTFDSFSEPTIGAAFLTKTVQTGDITHRLEIWDTAGQERYRALAPMYYRGATAALVVYDVTNKDTFNGAKNWINELQTKAKPNITIILVGNKYDLLEDPNVIEVDVADYLNENSDRIHYYQASCKTGRNVNEIFECAAREADKIDDEKYHYRESCVLHCDNRKNKKCCVIV